MRILTFLGCFLASLLPAGSVGAGGQEPGGRLAFEAEDIARFAKSVERELAQRRVRAALVARVGRPRHTLPKGVRFTHVGIALYSAIVAADGQRLRGYATYNLYVDPSNPNRSVIRQDYLFDFFADAEILETAIIVPVPELQRRLGGLVAEGGLSALHQPAYSAVSNPNNSEFQNCTELVLDAVNSALYQTRSSATLKVIAKRYFRPWPIQRSALALALAGLFTPGLRLTDHPGPVATATFGSLAAYLQEHDLLAHLFELRRQTNRAAPPPEPWSPPSPQS